MTLATRLVDGPGDAPLTVILAHGAGAPMDSPFMETMAKGLAHRGWRVVRFEFPYMARRPTANPSSWKLGAPRWPPRETPGGW
jgi:predicted alpha/beta-hydrolase family hydrolase